MFMGALDAGNIGPNHNTADVVPSKQSSDFFSDLQIAFAAGYFQFSPL